MLETFVEIVEIMWICFVGISAIAVSVMTICLTIKICKSVLDKWEGD